MFLIKYNNISAIFVKMRVICDVPKPAKYPTSWKPPVAVPIAPEIGGPAKAPIDRMLMNIPIRLPTSFVSPMSIMGLQSSETYEPEQNL
jgi:hypothetical protein